MNNFSLAGQKFGYLLDDHADHQHFSMPAHSYALQQPLPLAMLFGVLAFLFPSLPEEKFIRRTNE